MRTRTAVTAVAALALALTACSSDDVSDDAGAPSAGLPFASPDADSGDAEESADDRADALADEWSVEGESVVEVGDEVTFMIADTTDAMVTVTIDDLEYRDGPLAEDGTEEPADGHYARLTMTLVNSGEEGDADFSPHGNTRWRNQEHGTAPVDTFDTADSPSLADTFAPGEGTTGSMMIDLPEQAGAVTVYAGLGAGFTLVLPDA